MTGLPWSKFFWSDYASDPALKICSLAAQGLWMRMLCIASEHEPVGYVAVNCEGLDAEGIAMLVGARLELVEELLAELKRRGVYSVDRRGWIYSRRLVNDAKKSRKASENGKKGGNPKLRKQTDNSAQDNLEDKGGLKGEPKPQKPEARVQRKETDESVSKKTKIPDGFEPEPFGEGSASRAIVDRWDEEMHKRQLEAFTAHHVKSGSRFASWQSAWSTWVLNSEKFAKPKPRQPEGGDYLEHFLTNELPRLKGGGKA
jgi:hypothetical protein